MTGSLSGNVKIDLVGTPGLRPRSRWCVLWRLVDLCRVGGGSLRLCDSFVQFVWFLDPVSLINWVNSILSIRAVERPPYPQKYSQVEPAVRGFLTFYRSCNND